MESQPASPEKTTATLAIVGLVLAFIPVCPLPLAGVILGVIALVQINGRPRELKGRGLAIAAIGLGAMMLIVPTLVALTVPSFLRYQARARQGEAQVNLRSLVASNQAFQLEHGRRSTSFAELGFRPDSARRYAYITASDLLAPARGGPRSVQDLPLLAQAFMRGQGDEFWALAAGNIDRDEALDVWAITGDGGLQHLLDDLIE